MIHELSHLHKLVLCPCEYFAPFGKFVATLILRNISSLRNHRFFTYSIEQRSSLLTKLMTNQNFHTLNKEIIGVAQLLKKFEKKF